ncbi:MAG: DUF2314 domain-containing protein [Syntrophaceae bacterium]|nr:DUF2314 domain-containing protein [Syntrophaceae bacterium]
MVQVRCPECGYLQSLSEERFLSISDDFLNCPHCSARVPKQWGPCNPDHVPDEARHKMSAFSSRILNGGLIAKEVAHALESLVRRYGPFESSYKALGVGYTKLGDFKKAEEFLIHAKQQDLQDVEIDKLFLETFIGLERFEEAQSIGFQLIENGEASSDDIARTAFALFNLDETDTANDLLKAYPIIDTTSAAAKQLKRQMTKIAGANLGAKLKEKVNIKRFFGGSGKESIKSLAERAKNLFSAGTDSVSLSLETSEESSENSGSLDSHPDTGANLSVSPKVEYWIYSPESEIPKWDDVKRSFGTVISSMPARARAFKLLESLIASNDLNIEYILRSEARELFNYPEELIKLNARNFTDADLEALRSSQMIVRMELTPSSTWSSESLKFIVGFVEGLRNLTRGLVQDAISHTLWGMDSWIEFTKKPFRDVLIDHLHLDMLDENGVIWMHTHGMLKFGLPDLEIEGIPASYNKQGRRLLELAAIELITGRGINRNTNGEFSTWAGAIAVGYEFRRADEEGHFPDGVFLLKPYTRGSDIHGGQGLIESLKLVESGVIPDADSFRVSGNRSAISKARWGNNSSSYDEARGRIVEAHMKAKETLEDFKNSFINYACDESHVHAVKVGFPASEGKFEWMWVSLAEWENDRISGRLENAPIMRTDLYMGCPVELQESDIFDWVISSEGKILKGAFTETAKNLHDQ